MPAGVLLALAICSEVLATACLRLSDGFTRPLPAAAVVVGYGLAFVLLAQVLKDLEIGLTYAVWAGSGTALIALIGIAAWGEPMNALKALSLGAVIAGVVGLNLSNAH